MYDFYYLVDLDTNLHKFKTKEKILERVKNDFLNKYTDNFLIGIHRHTNRLAMGFVTEVGEYSISLSYLATTKAPDRRKFLSKKIEEREITHFLDEVINDANQAYRDAGNPFRPGKIQKFSSEESVDRGIIYLHQGIVKCI